MRVLFFIGLFTFVAVSLLAMAMPEPWETRLLLVAASLIAATMFTGMLAL